MDGNKWQSEWSKVMEMYTFPALLCPMAKINRSRWSQLRLRVGL